MHHNMLALFHGRNGYGRMEMVRGHYFDRIQVLFLFQQLPEISIGRASLILSEDLFLA